MLGHEVGHVVHRSASPHLNSPHLAAALHGGGRGVSQAHSRCGRRHSSRQHAKDNLGSGIVYALLALVMGENSKNSDLAKDAAQMVRFKPFFSFIPRGSRLHAPASPRLLQVANLVLMKYGRTDEARASRAPPPLP